MFSRSFVSGFNSIESDRSVSSLIYSSDEAISLVVKIGSFSYELDLSSSFATIGTYSSFGRVSFWLASGTFLDQGRSFLAFLNLTKIKEIAFLNSLPFKIYKKSSIKHNILPSTPRWNFVFDSSIYNILVQKYLMIVWFVGIYFSKKWFKLVAISSLFRYLSIVTFDNCLIFAWPVDKSISISIAQNRLIYCNKN